jgi:ribonucleotide reductase alpha subunit
MNFKPPALPGVFDCLKKKHEEGAARRVRNEDITVGAWIEKFTVIETSPRTGINASRNRPYKKRSFAGLLVRRL